MCVSERPSPFYVSGIFQRKKLKELWTECLIVASETPTLLNEYHLDHHHIYHYHNYLQRTVLQLFILRTVLTLYRCQCILSWVDNVMIVAKTKRTNTQWYIHTI